MHDTARPLIAAALAGAALGAIFFGGLWWTVRRLIGTSHGAGTLLASLLLRGAVVLAGFMLVGGGQWQRLLACLLGFLAARTVALRLARHLGDPAMRLSPDQIIYWQSGPFKLNATIAGTWLLMAALTLAAMLATRALAPGQPRTRWQNLLEMIVTQLTGQIAAIGLRQPQRYLGFVGTLFLFVAAAALSSAIPSFDPPTGSLSTTTALALCVLGGVPLYGILDQGWAGYLRTYLEPTPIMLPFNVIGEVSRTLALAVRLFGNMMSGAMISGILLSITPLLFPIVMTLLGLLTGIVQAYIFFILATVYLAAATGAGVDAAPRPPTRESHG